MPGILEGAGTSGDGRTPADPGQQSPVQAVEFSVLPEDWVAAACSAAGRDLTAAELETLLPGAEQRTPTCPE